MNAALVALTLATVIMVFPQAALGQERTRTIVSVLGDAHGHQFNSTLIHQHHFGQRFDYRILYSICNITDRPSWFFWPHAGFYMNEDDPQGPHLCAQRTNISAKSADEPHDPGRDISEVTIGHQAARIETIYWCEFLGFNRCGSSFVSGTLDFFVSLDIFAGGPDREPEPPVFEGSVSVSDGSYEVNFAYDPLGRRMIFTVAGADIETVEISHSLGDGRIEAQPLGDLVDVTDDPFFVGLNAGLPAFELPVDPHDPGEASIWVRDPENPAVAIVLVTARGSKAAMRLDVVDTIDLMRDP